MKRETHSIDAKNRNLGRLAVEISLLLRGKGRPGFAPNIDQGDFVEVKNAGEIVVTGKKMESKEYYHHTGYMGTLKKTTLGKIIKEKPTEALRKAVFGMLPDNKLRARQMKRLLFK